MAVYTNQWWGASARAHVRAPFPYLRNSWTHCAELCYMDRRTPSQCVLYKSCMGYRHLYARNRGVQGSILLKYGVLFDPLTMSLTAMRKTSLHVYKCNRTSFCAHLFTFACVSPKRHLTGFMPANLGLMKPSGGLSQHKFKHSKRSAIQQSHSKDD